MRAYLLTLLIISSLPIIVVKPYLGVLVYSWFSYMNPHRLAYGFAQQIPFALIIAVVTLGAWAFSRESKKFPVTPLSVGVLLFSLWVSVTTLFAVAPEAAYDKWQLSIKIFVFTFLTMVLINSRDRIKAIIWVIAGSVAFYGITGGIFVLLTGGQHRVYGPDRSFMADNNAIGLAIVMVLPLLRYLQLHARHWAIRLSLIGVMLLCVLAVLGTHSRGAALAGAAMLIVLWLRSRRRLVLGLVLLIGTAAGLAVMPQKYFDRLSTLGHIEADASAMSRLDTWRFAFEYALSRPIIGGGFSVFGSEEVRAKYSDGENYQTYNAHSIWFEVLAEHGFVGLFLFVMIGLVALLTCGRARRRTRGDPEKLWAFDLASSMQVSLIGFVVGGTFLNKAFFDLYWQMLAVIVGLSVLVARETAKEAPSAAPMRERFATAETSIERFGSRAGRIGQRDFRESRPNAGV